MTRAVFLDRDGTLIVERAYLATVDGVALLPGVDQALARLADHGLLLVLVTNQSGIGRGLFTRALVDAQHERLAQLLTPAGVRFADIQVCPHRPEDDCECRKPRPTMLVRAADRLGVRLADSFMVGDKPLDVTAGRAAGCHTVFLGAGPCPDADACLPDLPAAADWILAASGAAGPRPPTRPPARRTAPRKEPSHVA